MQELDTYLQEYFTNVLLSLKFIIFFRKPKRQC